MQRLEVSGAVRPIYGSLGVERLIEKMMRRGKAARINGQRNTLGTFKRIKESLQSTKSIS